MVAYYSSGGTQGISCGSLFRLIIRLVTLTTEMICFINWMNIKKDNENSLL